MRRKDDLEAINRRRRIDGLYRVYSNQSNPSKERQRGNDGVDRRKKEEDQYSDSSVSSTEFEDDTDSSDYSSATTDSEADTARTESTTMSSSRSTRSDTAGSSSRHRVGDEDEDEEVARDGDPETNHEEYTENLDDMVVSMVMMLQKQPLGHNHSVNQQMHDDDDGGHNEYVEGDGAEGDEKVDDEQHSEDTERVSHRSQSTSESPSHEVYT